MYVYLKYGVNWTTNMGDMAKKPYPILVVVVVLVLQFESKTVRGTDLNFCTQVGSDDPTCSDRSMFVNNVVYL